MYSALAGTFFILSIGILMAHAMEAFWWREAPRMNSVEHDVIGKFGRIASSK
jgi:hypothetical protein